MNQNLIAPCGINCALCMRYQRKKKPCPGCREHSGNKYKSCLECIIINCDKRQGKDADYCYVCEEYPCKKLKGLDKVYRTKYSMSLVENLSYIAQHGVDAFMDSEQQRWKCENCGELICVHRGYCVNCNDKK